MEGSDDIDREPAIGMFNFGESFFDAAGHLAEAIKAEELRLRFDSPIYYLYSHALELTLKAFLRAKSHSADVIRRRFGHKLFALWRECVKEGLSTIPNEDAFNEQMIQILDPLATAFEFRYLNVGLKQMPKLDEVEMVIRRLRAAVEPVVRLASPSQS